jgi:hypothetical protein
LAVRALLSKFLVAVKPAMTEAKAMSVDTKRTPP